MTTACALIAERPSDTSPLAGWYRYALAQGGGDIWVGAIWRLGGILLFQHLDEPDQWDRIAATFIPRLAEMFEEQERHPPSKARSLATVICKLAAENAEWRARRAELW